MAGNMLCKNCVEIRLGTWSIGTSNGCLGLGVLAPQMGAWDLEYWHLKWVLGTWSIGTSNWE